MLRHIRSLSSIPPLWTNDTAVKHFFFSMKCLIFFVLYFDFYLTANRYSYKCNIFILDYVVLLLEYNILVIVAVLAQLHFIQVTPHVRRSLVFLLIIRTAKKDCIHQTSFALSKKKCINQSVWKRLILFKNWLTKLIW